jgi:thioredoxin 1
MPKPIALAERNFDELFDRDGIIVVNFWSKAYPPSMNFNTIFEAASQRHEDVIFATLDVETETVLADEFGVEFVPSVFVMRDGEPVIYDDQPFTPEELETLIADVREVDMDLVRAENESYSKGKPSKAKAKARPAAKKVATKTKAKATRPAVSPKKKKPAPKPKKRG